MEQGTVNRRQPFRWGARARTLTVDRAQTLIGISGLLAACAYLLVRLAPDVRGSRLHADEAVSGLVAARPLTELWSTVIDERGGPPLHFLAAHLALALDPSADALRWTSVAFALGTVIVCYDLGRRIAGPMAGATAALLAATSTMLGQFGSFGRMYAAFAFTAALAADMFYRALEQRHNARVGRSRRSRRPWRRRRTRTASSSSLPRPRRVSRSGAASRCGPGGRSSSSGCS